MNQQLQPVLQSVQLLPQTVQLLKLSKHFGNPCLWLPSGREYHFRKITNSSLLSQKNSFQHLSSSCALNRKLIPRIVLKLTVPLGSCCVIKARYVPLEVQRRHFFKNKEPMAPTVWRNVKELKSSPVPALVFGFLGLLPFVSVPIYMTMSQMYIPEIAFAQLTYGAGKLSFLGGLRWGFVLPEKSAHQPDWINLGYSVTPVLVAWIGLLLPDPVSVFTVMAGLAGAAYFDTAIPGYPPWFKGFRLVLSIAAVLSLWTTFMCKCFLCSSKDIELDKVLKSK